MVKIGILSLAHMHANAYAARLKAAPDAAFVGLWDDDAERRQRKAAEYEVPPFSEPDALLETCDAVVVCAENARHRPLVERAAAAGKHILCEKPLATTPQDARAMVDACRQAQVQLMTAFPTRFSPAFASLLRSVHSGELGEVLAVRGTNRGRCPGGWFIDKALSGGGAIMDHTVHVADLLRALLQSEPAEVYGEADNRILHGDVEDTGFLTITFDSGVFATLDSSWSRPKTFPTWGDVTLGVTGTRGVIEMDMFGQEMTLYDDKKGRVTYQGWGSNIDKAMVSAFVRAVASGEPVPVTGVDGLRAVEVVAAAYRSIETGQPAPVERLKFTGAEELS
jgi:predicted dehydrogenase